MEQVQTSPPQGRATIPLSDYTTWKVGGPAEWLTEPPSRDQLMAQAAWAVAAGIPFRCIGAGSNLLIADSGLEGLTLCTRRLQGSTLDPDSGLIDAEVGEPIPTLARRAARAGLRGLEWSVGIPGTVGGAVVMNAGAQGGCTAEWLVEPSTRDALMAQAAWAVSEGIPFRSIGAGSNLLIADAGLDGLTLCTRRLQGSSLDSGSGLIEAEVGEPIPTLARRAARAGLRGLEWSVGIPGTVGGAVVMNAGAQGGCTAEWLDSIEVLDPGRPDAPFRLMASDLAFAYRHSRLQEEPLVVLSARFQLDAGHDPAEVMARTSSNLHSRTSTQPYKQPSCGSVFRNPEPRKAGQLIESLGLKGLQVGGAQVSTLHANFIVNTGGALASDIRALIQTIQERVRQSHGIPLITEVKRLGF